MWIGCVIGGVLFINASESPDALIAAIWYEVSGVVVNKGDIVSSMCGM